MENTKVTAEGLTEIKRKLNKKGNLIVWFSKGKTLQDYIDEYTKFRSDAPHHTVNDLYFEDCCGIMANICNELNNKYAKVEGSGDYHILGGESVFICGYRTNTLYETTFKFNTKRACEEAIEICGKDFLKKLFRI